MQSKGRHAPRCQDSEALCPVFLLPFGQGNDTALQPSPCGRLTREGRSALVSCPTSDSCTHTLGAFSADIPLSSLPHKCPQPPALCCHLSCQGTLACSGRRGLLLAWIPLEAEEEKPVGKETASLPGNGNLAQAVSFCLSLGCHPG